MTRGINYCEIAGDTSSNDSVGRASHGIAVNIENGDFVPVCILDADIAIGQLIAAPSGWPIVFMTFDEHYSGMSGGAVRWLRRISLIVAIVDRDATIIVDLNAAGE